MHADARRYSSLLVSFVGRPRPRTAAVNRGGIVPACTLMHELHQAADSANGAGRTARIGATSESRARRCTKCTWRGKYFRFRLGGAVRAVSGFRSFALSPSRLKTRGNARTNARTSASARDSAGRARTTTHHPAVSRRPTAPTATGHPRLLVTGERGKRPPRTVVLHRRARRCTPPAVRPAGRRPGYRLRCRPGVAATHRPPFPVHHRARYRRRPAIGGRWWP